MRPLSCDFNKYKSIQKFVRWAWPMGLLNNTTKLWHWEMQPFSSSILDRNIGSFYNIALGHNLRPENAEVPPTAHLRSLPNVSRGQTITQLRVTKEVHKLMVNKPAQSWVYRLNKIIACSFYRQAEASQTPPIFKSVSPTTFSVPAILRPAFMHHNWVLLNNNKNLFILGPLLNNNKNLFFWGGPLLNNNKNLFLGLLGNVRVLPLHCLLTSRLAPQYTPVVLCCPCLAYSLWRVTSA